MSEIWKPYPDYEDQYMVSNTGKVWSLYGDKELKQATYKATGYKYVSIHNRAANKGIKRKIHHLVLETFIGFREEDQEACHNDGSRDNNHLSNLRWGTKHENMQDKKLHGTHIEGEDSSQAKLTEDQVREIHNRLSSGEPASIVAKEYGIDKTSVICIGAGKSWKYLNLGKINYFWHPEFKSEEGFHFAKHLVDLVDNSGKRKSEIARELGIDLKNFYRNYNRAIKNIAKVEEKIRNV